MIEIMIERWSEAGGGTDFLWSIWREGRRVTMGGPHGSIDASEAEARQACLGTLGREPDRVTRL